MTKTAGPVNVVDVAGVNPDVQPVAVIHPPGPAPRGLALALHMDNKGQARFAPGRPHVSPDGLLLQLRQTNQPMFLVQLYAIAGP